MGQLAEHPTVKQFHARERQSNGSARPQSLDREWFRQVCLEAGADDVGFVEIDRAEIADQKADILWLLPKTKTLISFVVRMNRENIRTPARSIANLEFHHTTDETNEAAPWKRTAGDRRCGSFLTSLWLSLRVSDAWGFIAT